MSQREGAKILNNNSFLDELQARLPGLNALQALGWASATVKHLTQYLDASGREHLAKYLPPTLIPIAQEAKKLAELLGNERPGDFFVMSALDAGSPPSKKGTRDTLATVMAVIRRCIPEQPAREIAKALPGDVAALWDAHPLAA